MPGVAATLAVLSVPVVLWGVGQRVGMVGSDCRRGSVAGRFPVCVFAVLSNRLRRLWVVPCDARCFWFHGLGRSSSGRARGCCRLDPWHEPFDFA